MSPLKFLGFMTDYYLHSLNDRPAWIPVAEWRLDTTVMVAYWPMDKVAKGKQQELKIQPPWRIGQALLNVEGKTTMASLTLVVACGVVSLPWTAASGPFGICKFVDSTPRTRQYYLWLHDATSLENIHWLYNIIYDNMMWFHWKTSIGCNTIWMQEFNVKLTCMYVYIYIWIR